MNESSAVFDGLDRIGVMVNGDEKLNIEAFGLLLLGRKFKENTRERISDPTDLLLRDEGPEVPDL